MNFRKLGLLVLLALVLITCSVLFSLTFPSMTDNDRTLSTINRTSKAIGRFYRAHGYLPSSLDKLDLPYPCLDAWHNPIVYQPLDSNAYVLKSYGEQGKSDNHIIGRIFDADDVTTDSSRRVR